MKISILMPVFNVKPFIGECLSSLDRSLSAYTGPVLNEIVIVDDASTDGSFEVVKQYSAHHDNVVIVRHDTNKGRSEARNSAMRVSSGEYIAWVDPDDKVDVEWFASISQVLERQEPDAIAFDWKSFSAEREKVWRYGIQRFGIKDSLSGYVSATKYVMDLLHAIHVFAVPWQRVVRKCMYDGLKHVAPREMDEDIVIAYEFLPRIKSVYYISKALYSYRDTRPNSSMNSRTIEGQIRKVEYFMRMMDSIDAKYLPALRYLILHTMRSTIRESYREGAAESVKTIAKRYRRYHRKWLLGVCMDRYVPIKRKIYTCIFAFPIFKFLINSIGRVT